MQIHSDVLADTTANPAILPCDSVCLHQRSGFVPSQCIKLAEISGCAPSPPGRTTKHGHPHTFSVVTERRTFHLIADGEGDLHAWVNAIHHNIALVQRAHRKQQPAGTG
jgi:hypothetical protein